MKQVLFVPRKNTPGSNDNNYRHYTKGGVNYAIEIKDGSVLPNCVGYAWGRWRELLGAFHQLSRANAEDWYGKKDGYVRSQKPVLGAIVCWSQGALYNGNDGAGHVAVVEDILRDGSIVISNSDYKGSRFYTRTIKPPYNIGQSFKLQGFIHPPVNFVTEIPTNKEITLGLIAAVLNGEYGNGTDRQVRLEAAGYDYKAVQHQVNKTLADNAPVEKPKPQITPQLISDVRNGVYGNGAERVNKLTALGYDAAEVQTVVNTSIAANAKPVRKDIRAIAKEVIRGDWGNGAERKTRLEAAGYNFRQIQAEVNRLV